MLFKDGSSFFNLGVLFLCHIYIVHTEHVHFSLWIKTKSSENVHIYDFETLTGQGIQMCIDTCKAKKQCKFINFNRRMNLCSLIGTNTDGNFKDEDYLERKAGLIFGNKAEWNMSGYEECDECNENGICTDVEETQNSMCLNSDGGKILYKCVDGYKKKHAMSTCLENGNWSTTSIVCLPETAFFFEFNNTLYQLLRVEQVWEDAKNACGALGGQLAVIKSHEEHMFFEHIITEAGSFRCYWIGGKKQEDELTWVDGTLVHDGYTNFHFGQPDSSDNVEDCLQLIDFGLLFGYKWNDGSCNELCHAFCKLQ